MNIPTELATHIRVPFYKKKKRVQDQFNWWAQFKRTKIESRSMTE